MFSFSEWEKKHVHKQLQRLKLHLSRHVAYKCFVDAIENSRVSKLPRQSMTSVKNTKCTQIQVSSVEFQVSSQR